MYRDPDMFVICGVGRIPETQVVGPRRPGRSDAGGATEFQERDPSLRAMPAGPKFAQIRAERRLGLGPRNSMSGRFSDATRSPNHRPAISAHGRVDPRIHRGMESRGAPRPCRPREALLNRGTTFPGFLAPWGGGSAPGVPFRRRGMGLVRRQGPNQASPRPN